MEDPADMVARLLFDSVERFNRKHPLMRRELAISLLGRIIALCDRAGVDVESSVQAIRELQRNTSDGI